MNLIYGKEKTGTARIALSYEELQDFDGNLKNTPIALDYSDSIQFRSTISHYKRTNILKIQAGLRK
jgi:hypothetical protein